MTSNEPKITEIQILPIKPQSGLIGFASFVLNDSIYLSSIGIHTKIDCSGVRLTYPTKIVAGQQITLFHPINKETSLAIEQAVFTKYKELGL